MDESYVHKFKPVGVIVRLLVWKSPTLQMEVVSSTLLNILMPLATHR